MYPRLQISTFRVYQLWRRIDNDGEMKRLTPIVKFYSILNVMISKLITKVQIYKVLITKVPPARARLAKRRRCSPFV